MKKLLILFALILFTCPSWAYDYVTVKESKEEQLINKIGFTILNANRIPYRTSFVLNTKNIINASARYRDKKITVYKGLLYQVESDDELAAVLAHEISHVVDYSEGAFRGYFSYLKTGLSPRKYETKADKRAVDYLVKAGYNPLSYIVISNKIFGQERYEWLSTHPTGSKRMAEVYEYIYTKYPQYLAHNSYKDNIYYQNFLLTSRENRAKFEQKIKTNSKKKINYI